MGGWPRWHKTTLKERLSANFISHTMRTNPVRIPELLLVCQFVYIK
jgi:hypothetical protein